MSEDKSKSTNEKDRKDKEEAAPKPPPVVVHLAPLEMRAYGTVGRKE